MEHTPILPDTVLSIYCLAGEVAEDAFAAVDSFIGNWTEDGHSFLFFRQPADDEVKELVLHNHNFQLIDQYTMSYEQWQGGALEPLQLGSFLFSAPWVDATPLPGQHHIIMDPGVVFGDAMHQTTRDCLTAIEIACSGGTIKTMTDFGTGTGVLALASALLGVNRIIAVDYTMIAARTARRNVELNGLTDAILVVNGKAQDYLHTAVDLMVANIQLPVMKEIVESDGFLCSKWFVLSGLLQAEAQEIQAMLAKKPVHIHRCWCHASLWQTILGTVAA